nr:hypothetical protein [Paraburkholderia silvatlantica]
MLLAANIRTLRGGQTRRFGSFDDEHLDEHDFESRLASSPGLAIAECWYWTRKMQARYLAGDHETALESLVKAQSLIWTSSMFIEEAEFHFYAALTLAASLEHAPHDERDNRLERLAKHQAYLNVLATHFPENFENRAALVGAEMARIESRMLDAEHLYEQAINLSNPWCLSLSAPTCRANATSAASDKGRSTSSMVSADLKSWSDWSSISFENRTCALSRH